MEASPSVTVKEKAFSVSTPSPDTVFVRRRSPVSGPMGAMYRYFDR